MSEALLASSLRAIGQLTPLHLRVSFNNHRPLGEVYNEAIDEAGEQDVLVFVHDDVFIDDWMALWRIQEALTHFDVVGVVGNRRCQPQQETWYLQPGTVDATGWRPGPWDSSWLSGAIQHGSAQDRQLSNYGPTPQAVRLIDGVFMAARASRLKQSGVRFDPQLGFHFYDLDFCQVAHAAGLRIGTWPVAITHASPGGSVHSAAWLASRLLYLEKWKS